jgi:serine/threonine protein kinase
MDKELSANTNLLHYRIVSRIGAGGMGEVYLAEIIKPNRKVVSKFLYQAIGDDKDRN